MGIHFSVARGEGDMKKDDYDPNKDGIIALAQTEADMTKAVYDSDEDSKIDLTAQELAFSKIIPSDDLLVSSDGEVSTFSNVLTLMKTLTIAAASGISTLALRIKFSIRSNMPDYTSEGQIYKNGVAVGTLRTYVGQEWEEFSEDVSGFVTGDAVQIYGCTPGSCVCYISNFRIYGVKTYDVGITFA